MVRFLQAFFPMVRADTSSTLSAFATVSWIAFFGYVLDFLYRPLFQPKVSSLQNSSASFVIFSMHVRCLLITLGSGIYRNPSCMPGPLTSAFVQLSNFTLDLLDKQYYRRELARRRKLIQLSRDRIAYYEPALKIWHHQGNFYQGICIVLQQASDTERRLALESSLIRSYQPSLNAPWVGRTTVEQLRLHEPKFVIPAPTTGIRFVRRAHRHARYRHAGIVPSSESLASPSEICVSLYRLGSNAKTKFEEARLLRSRNTPWTALYLRARLLKFVDEPWQTRPGSTCRTFSGIGKKTYPVATHL